MILSITVNAKTQRIDSPKQWQPKGQSISGVLRWTGGPGGGTNAAAIPIARRIPPNQGLPFPVLRLDPGDVGDALFKKLVRLKVTSQQVIRLSDPVPFSYIVLFFLSYSFSVS